MSEEQVSDTIEKLYDRLDDYDKQQLMNYGYLMEYTRTLEKEVKYQNDIVIKQKEVLDKIKEYRKWLDKNTVIYNSGECVKLNGTYWEAEGIKIILDKLLEEIE